MFNPFEWGRTAQELRVFGGMLFCCGFNPIGSMYGIFTYIWLIFRVNVGKYTSPMDPLGMSDVKS